MKRRPNRIALPSCWEQLRTGKAWRRLSLALLVAVMTLTAQTAGAEDPTKQFPTGSGGDAGTGVAASETLYGDVNVDGSVDNLDVTLINKYLLGTAELSEQGKKNADVDANGTIDTTDSLNILKCCLELIEQSEFPIK